jgi:AraC-like DNA-binding protein
MHIKFRMLLYSAFHQQDVRGRHAPGGDWQRRDETLYPIDTVSSRSGFGAADNLRRHFSRILQTTPQAYRRTFQDPVPVPGRLPLQLPNNLKRVVDVLAGVGH